jgi:hypothetical protein
MIRRLVAGVLATLAIVSALGRLVPHSTPKVIDPNTVHWIVDWCGWHGPIVKAIQTGPHSYEVTCRDGVGPVPADQ